MTRPAMTPKERVQAAVRGLPSDRIPCAELVIGDSLVEQVIGGKEDGFAALHHFVQEMGLDAVCLPPACSLPEAQQRPAAEEWDFPSAAAWSGTERYVLGLLDGPAGWGQKLLGFQGLMKQLMRKPEDFAALSDEVEALNRALMRRLAEAGASGVVLADDIAFQQGVLVHPDVLRRRWIPALTRQVDCARQCGLDIFFHSDGNLNDILEDIVGAGFDGLQCLERRAGMNIPQVKAKYGSRLCLWGNLDPALLTADGDVSALERAVGDLLEEGGGAGGFIFGTSSGLYSPMEPERLRMVYQKVREQPNIEQQKG